MRRIGKWFFGIALFLMLSGLILVVTGRVMGAERSLKVQWDGRTITLTPFGFHGYNDWGSYWDLDYGYEEAANYGKETTIYEDELDAFSTLEIDLDLGDLTVVQGEDYGVDLRWNNENGYRLNYKNEGGTLKVWSTGDSRHNSGGNNRHSLGGSVVVYVPQGDRLDRVDIEVDLGDISVDGLSMTDGTIKCNLGEMVLTEVTAATLDLDDDLGAITLSGSTVTKWLKADASMGDVDLDGELDCDVEATSDMGSVIVNTILSEDQYRCELSADMGTVTVNGREHGDDWSGSYTGGRGSHALTAKASMGSVDVTFLD